MGAVLLDFPAGLRETCSIMRHVAISLIVLLTACVGQQGYFAGTQVTRVSVGQSVFDIRLRGNLAEAIRVNPQYAPRLGVLRQHAALAMAQVSGCDVKGVLGDQAVMTGVLDCAPL